MELTEDQKMGDHKGSPPTKNATDVFPHQLQITNYEL